MRKAVKITLVAVLLAGVSFAMGMCTQKVSSLAHGNKIAVVKIADVIISLDGKIKELEEARKESSIKAVIVRIDSPGGAVGASQEMLEEIQKVAKEKPVVASFANVAASGGYYLALGATKIVSNAGAITGSIGVRSEHVDLSDLLSWAKVRYQTLKSGKFKDLGAPERAMTEEERELLQQLLEKLHEQFKEAVAQNRRIPMERVEELADGRVFTGAEAFELGLIDEVGGLPKAVEVAKTLAGIKEEPELIEMTPDEPWYVRLVNAAAAVTGIKQSTNIGLYKF